MSLEKPSFWNKLIILVLVLVLVIPILAACGDDEEETPTAAPTATITPTVTAKPTATATPIPTVTAKPTATATPTPTPTVSKEPIDIGLLTSWSGQAAKAGILVDQILKIINKQLDAKGGINVGGEIRPINWIKHDDKTQVADAVAGYKKLAMEGVSAVLIGGATAAALTATSDAAEETKVPLFSVGSTPVDLSGRPYTIRAAYPNATDIAPKVSDFVLKELKPKTVGLLFANLQDIRDRASMFKKTLEAAGVKIVYEQYSDLTTTDFSPYLTKIKYENPDVLIADSGGTDAFYVSIFKQISGLGGWGNIKFVSSGVSSSGPALKESGAEGTYHWLLWMSGMPSPGSKEFETAWAKEYSERPTSGHAVMYQTITVALKAIEMAGSDKPGDIQKAARSGNFVWANAPGGTFKINADGTHNNVGQIVQYKNGVLTPVQQ
ncbi:MAG: ABC transporter substrate-binding protein [Dehalococcoidia bacterium]